MVQLLDLPTEILCYLFNFFDNPLDYYNAITIHPQLYQIGSSFNTRYTFLSKILILENATTTNPYESEQDEKQISKEEKEKEDCFFLALCRFLASAPIPISSPFAIDLIELIPSSYFCRYPYSTLEQKKQILQLFKIHPYHYYRPRRHMYAHTQHHITIPTTTNKTLLGSATSSNRHRMMGNAPRRVYYHVTLKDEEEAQKRKKKKKITTSFYHHQHLNNNNNNNNNNNKINNHYNGGILLFSNRATTTTTSLSLIEPSPSTIHNHYRHQQLQQQEEEERENIIKNTISTTTTTISSSSSYFCMLHDLNKVVVFNDRLECRHGKLWYEDEGILTDLSFQSVLEIGHQASNNYQNLRSTPVGYYDTTFSSFRTSSSTSAITSTLKRRQHGWRPCILATFYDCILKQNVKKGGLKKGDHFDGVFVFEHREDDTICMEFCQRDPLQKRWDRQGFLLFSEHHIEWH